MSARNVVAGIIDDGIAFAHERFRTGLDTRVEYWWLQDGPFQGRPADFGYGYELARPDINQLLMDYTRDGVVDEEGLYAKSHLVDFRRRGHKAAAWRAAHGTHVLDVFAGADPDDANRGRPIVAVQLPSRVTADTSGADLTNYAYNAMEYIVSRAEQIFPAPRANPLGVVINMSYGKIAGPHDGSSDLELLIGELVASCAARDIAVRVVLPAGNSYLSRCHAEFAFDAAHSQRALNWRVQPGDRTPSFLEIWLPCRRSGLAGSRIALTVTPPNGSPKTIREVQGAAKSWSTAAGVFAQMSYSRQAPPNRRGLFLVSLQPTARLRRGAALAPSGTWRIELTNEKLAPGEHVHAWVQRDDTPYGYRPRGRQSYFDDARYVRFDTGGHVLQEDSPASPVERAFTLNAIATRGEAAVIVIGSMLRRELEVFEESSGGPTIAPCGSNVLNRLGPDALTIGEDSVIHRGVLAAGTRSGSVVAIGGTSVAAPRIARRVAEDLEGGGDGDRDFVAKLAQDWEAAHGGLGKAPSVQRGGAGRAPLGPERDPTYPLKRWWGD